MKGNCIYFFIGYKSAGKRSESTYGIIMNEDKFIVNDSDSSVNNVENAFPIHFLPL